MSEREELDIVGLLFRRWIVVGICVALGGAVGLAYGFLSPKWFQARLTVVPSSKTANPAMGLIASLPGADALGVGGTTDVQRIQAVLESNSVADEVIAKFSLGERYGTEYPERTRTALHEHCTTTVDRKPSVVALVCEDMDPETARAMTAYFGEVGNQVFRRISASSAREERTFLETQVTKAHKDVDDASQRLRDFQENHRLVDLGEQAKAVISAMASIKGELVAKQLQLSYLTSFSSRSEADVVQLQQQIAIMEAKLSQLERSTPVVVAPVAAGSGSAGSGAGSDPNKFFPDAMHVPELRFELEQLLRAQKIEETVFFLLTQRYETAKVDEARDTSTFQILDHPTLPTYKSRPQRMRIATYGAAAGAAFACLWIVGPVWWRRRRGAASRVDDVRP